MDVFLYNGEISRGADLRFINQISDEKTSNHCMILMVTGGGDPDAAYKMSRYLQHKYERYSVLISGLCKSAGTLFTLGAHELIFTPYGELGPLDIQLMKTDHLSGMESGLNISEALKALDSRARDNFIDVTLNIIASSGGVVSFQTASHSASEIVGALYGPVFGRIDPEEVGSRSRAMRIGEDYGKRLNLKWNNMKPQALEVLSRTYPSHGFVIDSLEAGSLFNRVRMATAHEMELVLECGDLARHPTQGLTLTKLEFNGTTENEGEDNEEATTNQDSQNGIDLDGLDSDAAVEGERAATRRSKAAPGTRA